MVWDNGPVVKGVEAGRGGGGNCFVSLHPLHSLILNLMLNSTIKTCLEAGGWLDCGEQEKQTKLGVRLSGRS